MPRTGAVLSACAAGQHFTRSCDIVVCAAVLLSASWLRVHGPLHCDLGFRVENDLVGGLAELLSLNKTYELIVG